MTGDIAGAATFADDFYLLLPLLLFCVVFATIVLVFSIDITSTVDVLTCISSTIYVYRHLCCRLRHCEYHDIAREGDLLRI